MGCKAAVNIPPYFFIIILFLIICQHCLRQYISVLRGVIHFSLQKCRMYGTLKWFQSLRGGGVRQGSEMSSLWDPGTDSFLTFCLSSSLYPVNGVPLGEIGAFPMFLEIPENLDLLLQHPDAAVTCQKFSQHLSYAEFHNTTGLSHFIRLIFQ